MKVLYDGDRIIDESERYPKLVEYVSYSWKSLEQVYVTEKAILFRLRFTSEPNKIIKCWVPKSLVAQITPGWAAIHDCYTWKLIRE